MIEGLFPDLAALAELELESHVLDEPWVVEVIARAGDGDHLVYSWNAVARSVDAAWISKGVEVVRIIHERIARVSIAKVGRDCVFRAVLDTGVSDGGETLCGVLTFEVGARITVQDPILKA